MQEPAPDCIGGFKKNNNTPEMMMDSEFMEELSTTPSERARKAHIAFLRAMEETGTAKQAAIAMGLSEATVSRIKNEQIEPALNLLYQLGFKVVPQSHVCVQRDRFQAMATIAAAAMADPTTQKRLIWGDES